MNKNIWIGIVVVVVLVAGVWWYFNQSSAPQLPITEQTTQQNTNARNQTSNQSSGKTFAANDFSWQVNGGSVSLKVTGASGSPYIVGTFKDCEPVDPPYPPAVANEISRKICWNGGISILLNVVLENGHYVVKQTDVSATGLGTSKVLFEIK